MWKTVKKHDIYIYIYIYIYISSWNFINLNFYSLKKDQHEILLEKME